VNHARRVLVVLLAIVALAGAVVASGLSAPARATADSLTIEVPFP
jgi:hypothetical protein